jgi:hypothetical protein
MSGQRRYSLQSASAFAARLADRAAWHSGGIAERGRIVMRKALARSGVSVPGEFLELGCAAGNEASGLFSEFTAVLGCLQHYEQHRDIYCGMRVDFGAEGLYFDASHGRNWWEYYFEPIALGRFDIGRRRTVPLWQHDAFAEDSAAALARATASTLIQRYIRAKRVVLDQVDAFDSAKFAGAHVIGVHYRGTDKHEESVPVTVATVIGAVRAAADSATQPWSVFVATDDQSALDAFVAAFPGRVLSARAERSSDGTPVHKRTGDGFQKGLEACVDCYLLARCSRLIRTSSNLGLVASYLNPSMPVTLVSAQS